MKIDKQILSNFSFLSLVQVSNVLFPLITTPYIIGTIGIAFLGKITTCQTVYVFLCALCEFGFNVSGTRAVALAKKEGGDLSRLFSEVLSAKLLLLVISITILGGLIAFVPFFQDLRWLYILSLPMLIGSAIDPLWFFIGVEETRFLSIANLINKILYLLSVFVFIRTADDYVWVNFLFGLSSISGFIIGIFYLKKTYQLHWQRPSPPSVKRQLQAGFPLFLSAFAMQISQNIHVLILQGFQTDYEVGILGLLQRLITIAKMVVTAFNSAIFARACTAIAAFDRISVQQLFRNAYVPFVGLVMVGGGIGFFIADWVIWYFSGGKFEPTAADLLRGTLLIPFFQVLNIPATLFLQALNKRRTYMVVILLSAIMSIVLTWFLTAHLALFGTTLAMVLSELSLLIIVSAFAFSVKIGIDFKT